MNGWVYNSLQPWMNKLRSRFLRALTFCLLILSSLSQAGESSDWTAAERQLAERIASVTGRGAVSLQLVNRSSLSNNLVDEVRSGLISHLGSAGVRVLDAQPASASIQVSLSENFQSYVWVAEIRQGIAPPATIILSVPRPEARAEVNEPLLLLIRKIQLWSQDTQILDVGVIDSSPPALIVLDPEKIGLYRLDHEQWKQEQSFAIRHNRPWPRDLRGRVLVGKDHLFDVYLPGVSCSSTANPPLAVNCREGDDPWPLGTDGMSLYAFFSPSRNFFTGALARALGQQTMVANFYSAAPLPRDKYVLWLLAGVDGQVHELDGMNEQAVKLGWGSDIASVKTSCGSLWQVLATSSTDGVMPDTVRAYEFRDRDPVPVGQPAEFSGPVTSLWTEAGGSSAVAIVRNLETGKYAAFRLAITCGQ